MKHTTLILAACLAAASGAALAQSRCPAGTMNCGTPDAAFESIARRTGELARDLVTGKASTPSKAYDTGTKYGEDVGKCVADCYKNAGSDDRPARRGLPN